MTDIFTLAAGREREIIARMDMLNAENATLGRELKAIRTLSAKGGGKGIAGHGDGPNATPCGSGRGRKGPRTGSNGGPSIRVAILERLASGPMSMPDLTAFVDGGPFGTTTPSTITSILHKMRMAREVVRDGNRIWSLPVAAEGTPADPDGADIPGGTGVVTPDGPTSGMIRERPGGRRGP